VRVVGIDNGSFDRPEPVFSEAVDPEVSDEVDEQALPLVLVTWRDAWFDFDQPTSDDSRADYLVRTVGFLVSDGPRFLSVAQEVLPDGDGFRAVTHIPVSLVEAVVTLEQSPPEVRPSA
jgi:hypothetical protein